MQCGARRGGVNYWVAMLAASKGETPLHAACRAASLDLVRELLSECNIQQQQALMDAKCFAGKTPLMLAAMAGGSSGSDRAREAVACARFLLACGANAYAHSQSRRSAADYANEHGKPRLAEEIQRVATAQLQAAAINDGTALSRSKAGAHCALCGDRLGGCKFRAMHEAVRRGEQRNPLICRFLHDLETCFPPSAAQLLSSPALHCLNRRGKFTRELTEALAMLAQLRRIIARTELHSDKTDETDEPGSSPGTDETDEPGSRPGMDETDEPGSRPGTDETDEPGSSPGMDETDEPGSRPGSGSWHVIDLCCGKAFFGTLVAVLFPSFCVHCVDQQPPTFLPHFALAGLAERVAYVQLDVLSTGFVNEVRALIEANGGRRVIVMGMHLCGLLALRAIDLIKQLPRVEALVLTPCCLPNAAHAEDTPPSVFEPREPHAQYTRWCDFLERRIQGGVLGHSQDHSQGRSQGRILGHARAAVLAGEVAGEAVGVAAAAVRSEVVGGVDWRPEACLGCTLECGGCTLECSGCTLECTRESEPALISEKNTLLTARRVLSVYPRYWSDGAASLLASGQF